MARTAVFTVLVAVSMITCAGLELARSRSKVSRPSMPGMRMSSRTTSKGRALASSRAASPLAARVTSARSFRMSRRDSRTLGSSSTTRTLGCSISCSGYPGRIVGRAEVDGDGRGGILRYYDMCTVTFEHRIGDGDTEWQRRSRIAGAVEQRRQMAPERIGAGRELEGDDGGIAVVQR